MIRVLFLCTHNSARSQMAEAYLNHLGQGRFIAESAGTEPTQLNPYVVEAMAEEGINIAAKQSNSVFEYFRQGRDYQIVVTVCDRETAQKCPVFASSWVTLHWSFEDPSTFAGSHEEIMARVRGVRDRIRTRIQEMVNVFQI